MEKTTLTITFETDKPLDGDKSPMANLIDDIKIYTKIVKLSGIDIKFTMTESIS